MALPDLSPRVGRSQGVLIFWGLVSAVFAALFCYYFWQNLENESAAEKWRGEVLNLQDDRDALYSQKEKLQASMAERENQLKTREDFIQDKESKLAAEETKLQALGSQSKNQDQTNQSNIQSQVVMVKKFGETAHKLTKEESDIIVRGGRPVLRLPSSIFFASGDAVLKPEGKKLLDQVISSFDGQSDRFELRIAAFTDSEPEPFKATPDAAKPSNVQKKDAPKDEPDTKPRFATAWDLTAARAAALALYVRGEATLPFQNVLIVPRGDTDPVVTSAKEDHARNRRLEITFAPAPPIFKAPAGSDVTANPLAPPPDPPPPAKPSAPSKKEKEKEKK